MKLCSYTILLALLCVSSDYSASTLNCDEDILPDGLLNYKYQCVDAGRYLFVKHTMLSQTQIVKVVSNTLNFYYIQY